MLRGPESDIKQSNIQQFDSIKKDLQKQLKDLETCDPVLIISIMLFRMKLSIYEIKSEILKVRVTLRV